VVFPLEDFQGLRQFDFYLGNIRGSNPFSPNNEVTRLFFKTSKPVSKVTIKIFDFGMNPVRTVIQNATRTNNDVNFAIWDGRSDDGYIPANAVYFYRIEVDDETPFWGKVILMK